MIYDTFLFTSDREKDYGWRKKASYLPDNIINKCSALVDLLRLHPDLTEETWRKTLFFFTYKAIGMIVRILYCDETDNFGRPIFSFEGLSFEKVTRRRILDMPNIILFFYENDAVFRNQFYFQEKDFMGLKEQIHIPSIINPLEKDCLSEIRLKELDCSAFHKLIFDLNENKVDFEILFGAGAEKVRGVEKRLPGNMQIYDLEKAYEESAFEGSMPSAICEFPSEIPEKRVGKLSVQLENQKNKYGYKWQIENILNKQICYQSDMCYAKNGINYDILCDEEKKILRYMQLTGWDIEES